MGLALDPAPDCGRWSSRRLRRSCRWHTSRPENSLARATVRISQGHNKSRSTSSSDGGMPQCLTDINDQESLRGLGEGKDRNIFDSHHLLIEIVVIFSAMRIVKVINLGMVVGGNA